jgi:hypothetical protein
VNEDAAETLFDAQCLEKSLFLGDWKIDIARDEVGKPARLGNRVENLVDDFLWESSALTELSRAFARLFL